MTNNIFKNLMLWLVIFIAIFAVYQFINTPRTNFSEISYSEFLNYIEEDNIKNIEFGENLIIGEFKNSISNLEIKGFKTVGPASDDLITRLEENEIEFKFSQKKEGSLTQILINWAPLLILVGLMVFFMRQIQAGGTKAMSFGKNKARMLSEGQNKITFKDVAGVDEAKEEVSEIVEFLKNPKKFTRLGGRIPKGILLVPEDR